MNDNTLDRAEPPTSDAVTECRWRPIATAPKDETPVLVWHPDWEYPMFVRWGMNYGAGVNRECWSDVSDWDEAEPEYWFPTPALQNPTAK